MRPLFPLLALCAAVVAAPPAQAEPVAIPGADGLVLGGELELAEGKALSDGLILMVHGTLAHAGMEIIRGQQERLRDRGYSTLAITLSLGESERSGMFGCDTVHRHRHEDAVTEIARWVDWVSDQGVGPLTLWGHSRGGNQVARFATERAEAQAVDRVVLVAPATWSGMDQTIASYSEASDVPLPTRLSEAHGLIDAGKGQTVMEDVAFFYCPETDVTATSFASYYADDPRFDTPRLLEAIKQPTLVLVGDSDDVVPDLAERLSGGGLPENITFTEITMAGHMFRDFAGDDLADAVAEFVPTP